MTSRALVMLVLISACADFERGPAPVVPDAGELIIPGDAGSSSSFAESIEPMLTSHCMTCHRTSGAAASSHLVLTGMLDADLTQVQLLIDTASPATSRLLSKASGTGHGGGVVFAQGSPEYQTLFTWISEGAAP